MGVGGRGYMAVSDVVNTDYWWWGGGGVYMAVSDVVNTDYWCVCVCGV